MQHYFLFQGLQGTGASHHVCKSNTFLLSKAKEKCRKWDTLQKHSHMVMAKKEFFC